MGNWAFSWVQVVAHNKKNLVLIWGLLSALALAGNFFVDFAFIKPDVIVLLAGLLVIGFAVGYLLESLKIGFLQLLLSLYVLLMTTGLLGWLGLPLQEESILAIVVLLTVVSSNLVHLMSSLAREMARGLFQYDAVAEALKLNMAPVFLSNLTTVLGFVVVAYVDEAFATITWLVAIGALVSLITVLSWLPMILVSWLLEFRVGNTADRHGLNAVVNYLKAYPLLRSAVWVLFAATSFLLIIVNWQSMAEYTAFFMLLGVFAVLFWFAWQSIKLALLNLAVNVLALLVSIALFTMLYSESTWVWLLWTVPLGLIVDDGIHFFSRYSRAQQGFFKDAESAVTYAMASVGRAIWITSWVLLAGLAVLLFSQNQLVTEAALLTIMALVISTVLVLFVLPAMLLSKR